ncbi:MAG: hypothetical protein ACRCV0_01670, partial [Brevinema sp.]
ANGEYILYLDADDWFEKKLLAMIIPLTKKNPDLILFDVLSVKHYGIEKSYWCNKGHQIYSHHELFNALCDQTMKSWIVCGRVFKKDLVIQTYKQINLTQRLIFAEDLLFFIYFSYQSQITLHLPYNGYHYNLTNQSTTRTKCTLERSTHHLDNLEILTKKIHEFCTMHDIAFSRFDHIYSQLCHGFFLDTSNLDNADIEILSPKIMKIFGRILIKNQHFYAKFKSNFIRESSDYIIHKLFPTNSLQYNFIRKIILQIRSIIKK